MGTLDGIGGIAGVLSGTGSITGFLSGTASVEGDVTIPDSVAADIYDGDYSVTPTFELQTLETNGKAMADDVSVYAIPVSVVANLSGGNTVVIGG